MRLLFFCFYVFPSPVYPLVYSLLCLEIAYLPYTANGMAWKDGEKEKDRQRRRERKVKGDTDHACPELKSDAVPFPPPLFQGDRQRRKQRGGEGIQNACRTKSCCPSSAAYLVRAECESKGSCKCVHEAVL